MGQASQRWKNANLDFLGVIKRAAQPGIVAGPVSALQGALECASASSVMCNFM